LGGRYRGQEQIWFLLRFLGQDDDIDISGVDHPEFDAWRWAPITDALQLAVIFKHDIYAAVFAEFSPYLKAL
jgi:putative (di)nucleoside polyphosphate hydrolase